MNEQMQKALADILTMLSESAKAVGTAAQTEVPLLVQEYLRWGLWSAVLCALTATILLIAAWAYTARFRPDAEAMDDEHRDWMSSRTKRDDALLAIFWVRLIGFVLFGGIALYNGYVALQILIAPRVYLLETVMETLK